jgi:hypothetical protein
MKTLIWFWRVLRAVVLFVPIMIAMIALASLSFIVGYNYFRSYYDMALYTVWPYNDPDYKNNKNTFI